MKVACARASANIALAKYWGKKDVAQNLPAVPSLSLTLDGLDTVTRVALDDTLAEDRICLDGVEQTARARQRAVTLLDGLRRLAGTDVKARVDSRNNFPTAAGLASSASGFAALALAASSALGLELSVEQVSDVARRASASAARSVFGGWVALDLDASSARRVAPADWLDVSMLVLVTEEGPKDVGSTDGMQHTARTSPYYPAWVAHAPTLFAQTEAALLARDFSALGAALEQSALMMHASMLAAQPALIYFRPATLAALEGVRRLRQQGVLAFATMDAGPHVKVLLQSGDVASAQKTLAAVPGVTRTLVVRPGNDATLLPESLANSLLEAP